MSEAAWSEIEVALVKNKSRLISLKSVQPMKLLNPSCDTAAHVVLSGYGGGLLAGDKVNLQIKARQQSRLLLTTQANSRVFKSENRQTSEQHIQGHLEENSFTAFFPDPLIPHEKSNIRQLQEWHMAAGAVLLTVDWFSSGRSESGEQFLFSEYFSQIRIHSQDRPLLIDNQAYSPKGNNPRSKGVFGKYNHFINGFLAGDESAESFSILKEFFLSLNPQPDSAQHNYHTGQEHFIFTADHVKRGLFSFRAIGIRRLNMDVFVKELGKRMAAAPILGFDFFKRRF